VECVTDANPLGLRLEGSDRGFPFSHGRNGQGGRAKQFRIFHFHFLYSGFGKGKIVIWTPLKKKKTRILSQHSVNVVRLLFSPDGRFLASSDMNGKLIIWATEVSKKTEWISCNKI
jgi:WD40 repeat protein